MFSHTRAQQMLLFLNYALFAIFNIIFTLLYFDIFHLCFILTYYNFKNL